MILRALKKINQKKEWVVDSIRRVNKAKGKVKENQGRKNQAVMIVRWWAKIDDSSCIKHLIYFAYRNCIYGYQAYS